MREEEGQRATLVALRRLAGGNGYDGTQNIDGLHFEMIDAFLESNSGPYSTTTDRICQTFDTS